MMIGRMDRRCCVGTLPAYGKMNLNSEIAQGLRCSHLTPGSWQTSTNISIKGKADPN